MQEPTVSIEISESSFLEKGIRAELNRLKL